MKHTAQIIQGDTTVTLHAQMQPRTWKRVALVSSILFALSAIIGVSSLVSADESPKILFAVLGMGGMIFMWPIMPLLWNVYGKEVITLSNKAMRWSYDYGFFQMNGGPKTLDTITMNFQERRHTDGVRYGVIQFFTKDAQGFDVFLRESAIPIPVEVAVEFMDATVGLWPAAGPQSPFPSVSLN
jgi:hypothetical protein